MRPASHDPQVSGVRPKLTRLDVARAVTPAGIISPASVLIDGAKLSAVDEPARIGATPGARTMSELGATAVPGFVDLQNNGSVGHLFGEPGAWAQIAAFLVSTGTTAVCPTITSHPLESYLPRIATLADGSEHGVPRLIGAHLEGPFLSAARVGAHDPAAVRDPDLEFAARLIDESPVPIAIWTFAPELPRADRLLRLVVERGVVASAGHTDATFEEMRLARDRGLTMITHLFNAQRGLHHREPGVVGAGLLLDGLRCGLILDGQHVHPEVVGLVLRAAPERMFLVTDAAPQAGLPPAHQLGTTPPASSRDAPTLPDGTLAGSALRMDEAFRAAVDLVGIETAVHLSATTPARAVGRPDIGSLAPGSFADLLLLDAELEVRSVWVAGNEVWRG